MFELLAIWFISLATSLDTIFSRITENHGFLISAIGIVTVFLGLMILWAVTSNLKNIIGFALKATIRDTKKNLQSPEKIVSEENITSEIIAAITIALYFELEEEIQVITMRHIEQEMSPWVVASRSSSMRSK